MATRRREAEGEQRELVLVGGGHSHVQVLRAFAMAPPPRTRLTVVLDRPVAVYSGMVPGFVAGQYRAAELEIDVLPLARRAGARVVLAPATGVDATARRLHLAGRPSLPYDLAAFDIGSTVAGLELPGIRRHALPTRPIGRFVERVEEIVTAARGAAGPFRVAVVGGGAGGVELAFALERRLAPLARGGVLLTLVHAGLRLLPGQPEALARRAERRAAARRITVVRGRSVLAAEPDRLLLDDGSVLPCDALVWVAGAASHPLFRDSDLPTDPRGFVRVRSTLQVEGHDELLATGDCAALVDHPQTPKAGVYAVRQGPFLTHNLRALLAGDEPRAYRPQRDFLTLLNLGDGSALGAKRGISMEGRWVMRLKDRIDRRFMRRFQVLDDAGDLAAEFRDRPAMAGAAMLCGGCAAKVGQGPLAAALARLDPAARPPEVAVGLEDGDDVVSYSVPGGDLVVSSVDAFRAFTDDPHLVGRVAAVNALSDLEVKGVVPRWAQAVLAIPEDLGAAAAEEEVFQVLAGARAVFDPAGVSLLGGHTTTGRDLMVGFVVEGLAEAATPLLRLDALRAGQVLVLTKPLGTGVLLFADMRGRLRGTWFQAALASMQQSNAAAAGIARQEGASAATDVTGFGLAGHLGAMLRASGLAARLELAALPALPGALELLSQGLRSTAHGENERARRALLIPRQAAGDPRLQLLFDPQTCGGLLCGLPAERAAVAVERLRAAGCAGAAIIGRVTAARPDGALAELVA